jgi:putative membrane protein
MNRKTSRLISLEISVALIAAGIWFLYNHHNYFGYGDGDWIMPHHMMMGGGGMGIIMILFWGALLTAIILLVSGLITRRRYSDHNDSKPSADSDALEILKQRYASGEISKFEYENMRQDLQ